MPKTTVAMPRHTVLSGMAAAGAAMLPRRIRDREQITLHRWPPRSAPERLAAVTSADEVTNSGVTAETAHRIILNDETVDQVLGETTKRLVGIAVLARLRTIPEHLYQVVKTDARAR